MIESRVADHDEHTSREKKCGSIVTRSRSSHVIDAHLQRNVIAGFPFDLSDPNKEQRTPIAVLP